MRKQLQKPDNWQDFENLCHKLWRSIWNDPNAQKNGRIGQEQHGVDVFGRCPIEEGYTGVQCKGKNDNYGTALAVIELDSEYV